MKLLDGVRVAPPGQRPALRMTLINIDAKEISFGAATDFNPNNKDAPGPKTNGTGANATGVVINRADGKYFSISTRKYFSTDPLPEGVLQALKGLTDRRRQLRIFSGKLVLLAHQYFGRKYN